MKISKSDKITFIYDFIGPNNPIPNAINYFYSYKLFESEFNFGHETMDYFFKNFTQLSVCNYRLNINTELYETSSIYKYINDKNKFGDKKVYYLVEPFGSFLHFLGKQFGPFDDSNFIDFISKYSLNEIKNNPNFYLLINYGNEGVFEPSFFVYLYEILEKNKINPSKVILISSAVDIENIHKQIRNHNPSKIKNYYFGWSLKEKSKEIVGIDSGKNYKFWENINQINTVTKPSDLDESKLRPSKFLLMNRRLRPHRMILLALLGKKFVDDNLVSFDLKLFDRENDYDFYEHHLNDTDLANYALENSKELFKLKKSTIDFDNLETVWGFNFENKEPYINSYINICSETNFYEEGLYFSEKTWKPIAHLQPFIHINKSGALRELKKLGFKTFHPFIDESYDNEVDDSKRIKMIFDEIERLNKLSLKEMHDWYYSIKEILIYNRNHFLEFANKVDEMEYEFVKKILQHESDKKNQRLF